MTQTAKKPQKPKGPILQKLKLEPCCQDTLEQIRDKKEIGRALQAMLGASPFLLVFASEPLDAAVTVLPTDWDMLGKAMKSVPAIVRNRCRLLAGIEILRHKGGDLNRFWRAMYDRL